ncbi:MAG: ribose 5-phosphate isomerase A [Candidatus Altiarchaeales archaeon ex4484_2]|nr:MAG: ribose 5-phosphate isomerase A [Candidatus Altiarchaeales archaeon ex4484_2]
MNEESKKTAGEASALFVEDGMVLGLGTGSTVKYALEAIAKRIKEEGLDVVALPTSKSTEELASSLGIKLSSLKEYSDIDLCIDGADEVDEDFNLIKGGGGAHTREKIIASASKKFIVVVDESKMVEKIGGFPVAVEFLGFGKRLVANQLHRIGGDPRLRGSFETDNGNLIFDTKFYIDDPLSLEDRINSIPGVLENGIFSRRRPERVIVGRGEKHEIIEK